MFSEEIINRIIKLYSNDSEIAAKLLSGDVDAIRNMIHEYAFDEDSIIYAYEHNKIDELYQEAKREAEIKKLYHDLCTALAEYQVSKKK